MKMKVELLNLDNKKMKESNAHSQAQCQVAQTTAQPKPAIELVCLPSLTLPTLKKLNLLGQKNGMTELKNYLKPLIDKNAQLVTKAIYNKGFSGNSNILPRSNFGVVGQDSSPQSLTAYSPKPLPPSVKDRNEQTICYI